MAARTTTISCNSLLVVHGRGFKPAAEALRDLTAAALRAGVERDYPEHLHTGGGADCALPDQWAAMLIFDVLVGNANRDAQSIRYDTSSFNLMLAGHDEAFTTSGSKPARYKDLPLKPGPAWKAALAALSDDVLQENFADVLDKRRIKALGQRRDLLLSE